MSNSFMPPILITGETEADAPHPQVGELIPLFFSRHAEIEERNMAMLSMLAQGNYRSQRSIDKFDITIQAQIAQKPSVIEGQTNLVVQAIIQAVPMPNYPEGYEKRLRMREIATVDVVTPSDESVQKAVYDVVTEIFTKFYDWLEVNKFTEAKEGFKINNDTQLMITEGGKLSQELMDSMRPKPAANSPILAKA